MMNDSWDDTEIGVLKLCYKVGDVKDLASVLGRTVDSVRAKAKRMGLHARPSQCPELGMKKLDRSIPPGEEDRCRQTACVCYKACLNFAADRFWTSFTCSECKRFVAT